MTNTINHEHTLKSERPQQLMHKTNTQPIINNNTHTTTKTNTKLIIDQNTIDHKEKTQSTTITKPQ